jgi:hypothetical protein
MRAEIKAFHSPDMDWEGKGPENSTSFSILLQIFIGPKGGEGSESFDVTICTPEWIGCTVNDSGPLDGRHHLIVSSFNRRAIEDYFRRRVSSMEAASWPLLAIKLGSIGRWEYEDYE